MGFPEDDVISDQDSEKSDTEIGYIVSTIWGKVYLLLRVLSEQ